VEHLFFIAIVLALIEFKEFKQNRRYKAIQAEISALATSIQVQITKQAEGTAGQPKLT
jgi:hypothetical protein